MVVLTSQINRFGLASLLPRTPQTSFKSHLRPAMLSSLRSLQSCNLPRKQLIAALLALVQEENLFKGFQGSKGQANLSCCMHLNFLFDLQPVLGILPQRMIIAYSNDSAYTSRLSPCNLKPGLPPPRQHLRLLQYQQKPHLECWLGFLRKRQSHRTRAQRWYVSWYAGLMFLKSHKVCVGDGTGKGSRKRNRRCTRKRINLSSQLLSLQAFWWSFNSRKASKELIERIISRQSPGILPKLSQNQLLFVSMQLVVSTSCTSVTAFWHLVRCAALSFSILRTSCE